MSIMDQIEELEEVLRNLSHAMSVARTGHEISNIASQMREVENNKKELEKALKEGNYRWW